MSSNLVKQHYIITANEEKRVIDSNDRLEEKLREVLKNTAAERTVDADGFSAGLPIADTIEPEPPRDYVAEAKAEAEQILADAKNQADAILRDAQTQAEALCEEYKQRGYSEGKDTLEAEFASRQAQLEQELGERENSLSQEYDERFAMMEADLVDAIIQVFDKVFHIQFEDKREILLHLITQTIRQTESGKSFLIRVSIDSRVYLEEHLEEISAQIGRNAKLEIVGDPAFGDGDCRIETEFGIFDCGVDTQFQNLIRDIRSLCG